MSHLQGNIARAVHMQDILDRGRMLENVRVQQDMCVYKGTEREQVANMQNNLIKDIKVSFGIFQNMRRARKEGWDVTTERKMEVPVFSVGIGFYSTVEGCTLANCEVSGVHEIARTAFYELPYEIKRQLSNVPIDGEFVERANFWRNLLSPVMTRRQLRASMVSILHWYIHIKQMNSQQMTS